MGVFCCSQSGADAGVCLIEGSLGIGNENEANPFLEEVIEDFILFQLVNLIQDYHALLPLHPAPEGV